MEYCDAFWRPGISDEVYERSRKLFLIFLAAAVLTSGLPAQTQGNGSWKNRWEHAISGEAPTEALSSTAKSATVRLAGFFELNISLTEQAASKRVVSECIRLKELLSKELLSEAKRVDSIFPEAVAMAAPDTLIIGGTDPNALPIIGGTDPNTLPMVEETEPNIPPMIEETEPDIPPMIEETEPDIPPMIEETEPDIPPMIEEIEPDIPPMIEETAPGNPSSGEDLGTGMRVIGKGFLVDETGMICGISDLAAVLEAGCIYLPEKDCIGIAAEAFSACGDRVMEVYIPANITQIEENAFSGMPSLGWIEKEASEGIYTVDGVLFSEEGACLLAFPPARTGNYKLPSDVTEIASGAFANAGITILDASDCFSLERSDLPDYIELRQ